MTRGFVDLPKFNMPRIDASIQRSNLRDSICRNCEKNYFQAKEKFATNDRKLGEYRLAKIQRNDSTTRYCNASDTEANIKKQFRADSSMISRSKYVKQSQLHSLVEEGVGLNRQGGKFHIFREAVNNGAVLDTNFVTHNPRITYDEKPKNIIYENKATSICSNSRSVRDDYGRKYTISESKPSKIYLVEPDSSCCVAPQSPFYSMLGPEMMFCHDPETVLFRQTNQPRCCNQNVPYVSCGNSYNRRPFVTRVVDEPCCAMSEAEFSNARSIRAPYIAYSTSGDHERYISRSFQPWINTMPKYVENDNNPWGMSSSATRTMLLWSEEFRRSYPRVYEGVCKYVIDVRQLIAHEVVVPAIEDLSLCTSCSRGKWSVKSTLSEKYYKVLRGKFNDPRVVPMIVKRISEYIADKLECSIMDAEAERSLIDMFTRNDVENGPLIRVTKSLSVGGNAVIYSLEGSVHIRRTKGKFFSFVSKDRIHLDVDLGVKILFLNSAQLKQIDRDCFLEEALSGSAGYSKRFMSNPDARYSYYIE